MRFSDARRHLFQIVSLNMLLIKRNRKSKSNYLKQQISLAHIAEKSKLSWIHFIFSVILLDFPLLMVRRGEL